MNRPTITMADIMVCIDSLNGSLAIKDRGSIFRYTIETREQLREKLTEYMNSITASINLDKSTDAS